MTSPSPESVPPFQFPFFHEATGYHQAMETRMEAAAFGTGDVTAWMRRRLPLLADETPSPMQRVLLAADSASGVSAMLDPARFTFVNSDLTVAAHRSLEASGSGCGRPRRRSRTACDSPTRSSSTRAAPLAVPSKAW